jgi:hypothetical protein
MSGAACSWNDDVRGATTGGIGGSGGTAGTGGDASGGSAGAGQAGAGGIAGTGGESGGAGSAGAAGDAGASGSAGAAGSGYDPGTGTGLLLAGVTDYATKTEIVAVNLATNAVLAGYAVDDGNAVPQSSGGLGFILERTNDRVHLLASDGDIAKSIDVSDELDASTNVNRILAVSSAKAYAGLYRRNYIDVLDLTSGNVQSRVDLSTYLDAADEDGSIDVFDGAAAAASKRVYFVAQRIDATKIVAPTYQLPCSPTPGLLFGIETDTNTLVDLNGAAPGEAIELQLKSPSYVAMTDGDDEQLFVVGSGCYQDGVRTQHGIERVDLTSGTSSVLYEPMNTDYHGGLIPTAPDAALLLTGDSNFVYHWHRVSLLTGQLGEELVGIPSAPEYEGGNTIVGLLAAGERLNIVRYDMRLKVSAAIVEDPWQSELPFVAGSALVR